MRFLFYLWDLLGVPVDTVLRLLNLQVGEAWYVLGKIFVFVFVLYIVSKLIRLISNLFQRFFKRDFLLTPEEKEALERITLRTAEEPTAEAQDGKSASELINSGNWEAAAAISENYGNFMQAAKLYLKAGNVRKAALCYYKADKPGKAIKFYMKAGDYLAAADLLAMKKQYRKAAQLYEKASAYASAADSYLKARRHKAAAEAYIKLFESASLNSETRFRTAQTCLQFVSTPAYARKVPESTRQILSRALASEFQKLDDHATAARLYKAAGDLARAGEAFGLAGDLQSAEQCLRQAGKEREASLALAKHLESQKRYAEAGREYRKAEAFQQAGLCFTKANQPLEAASCFEHAGAFYRAGWAYAHARKFEDAIRCLQKIKESEPEFDISRALLGQIFFELHDYDHCAATLSNHLTGKRVESTNIEYFYMLALAYEQMGKLEESREILLRIRSINTSYRDVTTRLSNISSRISLGKQESAPLFLPTNDKYQDHPLMREDIQAQIGGRYRLEKELGRGGMGLVYLAHDTQLDRPVALKFLGNLIDQSEEFYERFLREARAAARISQPNIISIYDIGGSRGKVYIAMEYVEGGSLLRYIRAKGRLSVRETISVFVQVCSALNAIHEAGIVHRDIKPENILIAKGGLVKLTDFGLAKITGSRVTRTGAVMGTPSYMAPEQVLGKDTDPRTDLYATGLVMYECLTGKTVFDGGNVLERQLNETPSPPSSLVGDVPQEMDYIIMKCIEKEPEKRYSSAQELMADLRRL